MKKIITFALSFFVAINTIVAQDNYADSLKHELSIAKEDTNKVDILLRLSYNYQWSFPDSAIPYAQEGLQLAHKLNLKEREIDLYESLVEAFSTNGNYYKALEAAFKDLPLSEKSKNPVTQYWGFLIVGNAYSYSGNYENALKYYYKAKESKAILPRQKVLIFGFIGRAYFGLNEIDSALLYIQKCYNLDVSAKHHWAIPYYFMGAINAKKGQYKIALDYYREGINISTVNLDFADGYVGMASAFQKSNLVDSAILYAQKTLRVSQHASLLSDFVKASTLLTEIYTSNRITDSAFKYQSIMVAAKDSLFSQEKLKQIQNISFNEQMHQQEIKTERESFQNKIKLYASLACLFIFLLIAFILWRNNRHKQKAYSLLQTQKQEIDRQKTIAEQALNNLKSTQKQLIQSEKMASLGELTAGIAHEIQNPLNFVNNFSEVNTELLAEMNTEIDKGNLNEVKVIAHDITENSEKIIHHGKRADAIVKGMLQHSRISSGKKEPTNINALADEYLRLSYHGMRAKDKGFNATMKTDFDESIGMINVVPQDIGRVFLNLFNNAFYAASLPSKGGFSEVLPKREPTVWVSTKRIADDSSPPQAGRPGGAAFVEIRVRDNGNGIPEKIKDKIFQPFFTTKPTGEGTGLGLSLSYDMVKAHGGEISVNTKEGEARPDDSVGRGTEFVVVLPA